MTIWVILCLQIASAALLYMYLSDLRKYPHSPIKLVGILLLSVVGIVITVCVQYWDYNNYLHCNDICSDNDCDDVARWNSKECVCGKHVPISR
jgi:hypothetical protein